MFEIQVQNEYLWIDVKHSNSEYSVQYTIDHIGGGLYVDLEPLSPCELNEYIDTIHFLPLIYIYCYCKKAP